MPSRRNDRCIVAVLQYYDIYLYIYGPSAIRIYNMTTTPGRNTNGADEGFAIILLFYCVLCGRGRNKFPSYTAARSTVAMKCRREVRRVCLCSFRKGNRPEYTANGNDRYIIILYIQVLERCLGGGSEEVYIFESQEIFMGCRARKFMHLHIDLVLLILDDQCMY